MQELNSSFTKSGGITPPLMAQLSPVPVVQMGLPQTLHLLPHDYETLYGAAPGRQLAIHARPHEERGSVIHIPPELRPVPSRHLSIHTCSPPFRRRTKRRPSRPSASSGTLSGRSTSSPGSPGSRPAGALSAAWPWPHVWRQPQPRASQRRRPSPPGSA